MSKSNPSMTLKTTIFVNPLQPLVVDIKNTPLANVDYKIADPVIEFNILDLHSWTLEKSLDQVDEV